MPKPEAGHADHLGCAQRSLHLNPLRKDSSYLLKHEHAHFVGPNLNIATPVVIKTNLCLSNPLYWTERKRL
jgi:hypothetical protein